MTTLELLKAARELISDEARWTQGQYARDAEGFGTSPYEADAVCWCSLGAIKHLDPTWDEMIAAADVLDTACRGRRDILDFNDTHTHAEVLALFDRTIARLESEAAPC